MSARRVVNPAAVRPRGRQAIWTFLAALTTVAAMLAAAPASAAVQPPPGAGTPPPGSGIGTTAALKNPKCTTGERYGVYGRFNSTAVGAGQICVKPWKAGANNGGATAQGVTKTKVLVDAIVPNEPQLKVLQTAGNSAAPFNRADNSFSTVPNAVHDALLPLMKYYETWGRDVEIKFITSSGDDEAAQRADAVTVAADKPFAVLDFVSTGLDILDQEIAKNKTLVFGYATTVEKAQAQAPYRWGVSDSQAGAINAAEVIGKQLAGKKAEFAGSDDIKQQTRKFGVVYIDNVIDIDQFKSYLKKNGGGAPATEANYTSNGSTLGNAPVDELAPVMVTKMKEAGVTTVIMLSDYTMNNALMQQATKQDWSPEWYITGTVFQDVGLLARNLPVEQFSHAFGTSGFSPYTLPDPVPAPPAKSLSVLTNPLNWYWGEGVGTGSVPVPGLLQWLLSGMQTAGPKLTTQTFAQGLFSIPAAGGAAQGYPAGGMMGYGKTAGLPYDEYMGGGVDFAPVWWDAETTGPSTGTGLVGKGVEQFVNGGKRYRGGTVPKKQFAWFDKAGAVYQFETRQTPTPEYVGDCEGCPATGGPGQAGTPSASGFIAKAGGGDSAPS